MFANRFALPLLCCLTLQAICPALVSAQGDRLTFDQLKRKSRVVQTWLREPISAENQQEYEDFFKVYYFPAMLRTDSESLEELSDMRTELFQRYIWDAHPRVQQDLTNKAYNFARSVVGNGRYLPAHRYNAVLILGMLDSQYSSRSNPAFSPNLDANKLLCQIAMMCAKQQRLPNYLEVGALIGLQRHATQFDKLSQEVQRQMSVTLYTVVNQSKFSSGTAREVQYWIRLQAAHAMANTGSMGPKGAFARSLATLINDTKADTSSRNQAASYLSSLNLSSLPPAVGKQVSDALKSLACTVAAEEQTAAKAFEEAQLQRRSVRGMTQSSERYYYTDEDGWKYQRRGLIADLEQLKQGMQAGSKAPGAEPNTLDKIANALQEAIDVASTMNIEMEVVRAVNTMSRQVSEASGCSTGEPADEAPDALLGAAQ